MSFENLKRLKSGSDIRGTAVGEFADLTDDVCRAIARAFTFFVRQKTGKQSIRVAVGHDSRISADRISNAVCSELAACGAKVLFCGLTSTPAMFMIIGDGNYNCDASMQITASHHPYDRNGFKFFTKDGGLSGKDIEKILDLAQSNLPLSSIEQGEIVKVDYTKIYADGLIELVRQKTGMQKPLFGKKIVVDAGNGAGGFYAKVLDSLGADTSGSQFLQPDGMFPNHVPNPEDKDAMRSICDRVINTNADFGIIFDTDVDRAGAVGKGGREINRNRLIALISAILLSEQKGATIVTDSVTSKGLKEFIEKKGGIHRRFKRGYKNVIDEAIRLNNEGIYCPLAIETSGHAALLENKFLDDGAYLVTRLLISMANLAKENKTLEFLIDDLKEPAEQDEIRLTFIDASNFKQYGNSVIDNLFEILSKNYAVSKEGSTFEGIRINFDAPEILGWALVRMSVHDPVMPINIESDCKGGNRKIAAALLSALERFEKLNLENLKKYLSEQE